MNKQLSEATNTKNEKMDTILLVDDEENILKALQRVLRREGYHILSTTDPTEALKIASKELPSVIVSDQKMPRMSGSELLSQVKDISPDTVRIMLTGYADMQSALSAINEGQVFRFISKPWNDDELREVLRQATFQNYLVRENKRLMEITKAQNAKLKDLNTTLEKKVLERTEQLHQKHQKLKALYRRLQINFRDTVRVFVELTEMYDPFLGGHSKRVASQARVLAERLEITGVELNLVEIAAYLHDIGLIGFPREIYRRPYELLKPAQQALFRSHTEIGHALLQKIEFLRQVAVIVRSHHERYDGKGFPDGLSGNDIPIGARIIHLVSAYDHYLHRDGLGREKSINRIKRMSGRALDPSIVNTFQDMQTGVSQVATEVAVELADLREGMKLARQVNTASGRMLMAKDSELTAAHIQRMQKFNDIDPIVDRIYVYQYV